MHRSEPLHTLIDDPLAFHRALQKLEAYCRFSVRTVFVCNVFRALVSV